MLKIAVYRKFRINFEAVNRKNKKQKKSKAELWSHESKKICKICKIAFSNQRIKSVC